MDQNKKIKRKNKRVKRRSVSKNTKFVSVLIFFAVSFFLTRVVLQKVSSVSLHEKKATQKLECETEYDFNAFEAELLKISKPVNKPIINGERVSPCLDETNRELANYSLEKKKYQSGTDIKSLSTELKKKKKLKKLAEDEENPELYTKRLQKLKKQKDQFRRDYSRFKIQEGFPRGALDFGVIGKPIKEVSSFLDEKKCLKPELHFAHHELSYLSLFFTINAVRGYQGRVDLIGQNLKTLIAGKFGVFEYQREPFHRHLPQGFFEMWAHKKMKVDFSGHNYQRQVASQDYRFDWDRSPWLYNNCNKAISTVSNYCSLDPRFDMQLKDIFYSVRRDKIMGLIYCKKSYEKSWTVVGKFDFLRNQ